MPSLQKFSRQCMLAFTLLTGAHCAAAGGFTFSSTGQLPPSEAPKRAPATSLQCGQGDLQHLPVKLFVSYIVENVRLGSYPDRAYICVKQEPVTESDMRDLLDRLETRGTIAPVMIKVLEK